jgi:hypothetical protein
MSISDTFLNMAYRAKSRKEAKSKHKDYTPMDDRLRLHFLQGNAPFSKLSSAYDAGSSPRRAQQTLVV